MEFNLARVELTYPIKPIITCGLVWTKGTILEYQVPKSVQIILEGLP
jgi:hypothetical protein